MNRFLSFLLVLIFSAPIVFSQSRKERKALFESMQNFEITTVKVGTEGTKFVKVWGYGKKVDDAIVQAKKNAVYACIFRGLPASSTANATPAICRDANAYKANQDYFDNFFQTAGPYIDFVNMTTDGVPSGQDRLKVKKGYKVAIYVQVMFDNLRKKLEADGVVKGLSSGF